MKGGRGMREQMDKRNENIQPRPNTEHKAAGYIGRSRRRRSSSQI
jgi:hypothetical protein